MLRREPPPGEPARNLPLVQALTRLAAVNDEAITQAPPKLVPFLEATARAADEAARAVQFGHPLTERQAVLVAQCEKDLNP